ncbi:LPS-assembly lptD domain protein [Burkholderia thailandensis USAMRU Malaysia |nr:LPS-assembly lptD domain protein [Burkholderia thailandensis USAMRU Malaysia \
MKRVVSAAVRRFASAIRSLPTNVFGVKISASPKSDTAVSNSGAFDWFRYGVYT